MEVLVLLRPAVSAVVFGWLFIICNRQYQENENVLMKLFYNDVGSSRVVRLFTKTMLAILAFTFLVSAGSSLAILLIALASYLRLI